MIQGKQGEIGFRTTLDTSELEKGTQKAKKHFQDISQSAKKEGEAIKAALKQVATAMGLVFSAQQAVAFVKQVVNVRAEIQALEVSFRTLLGSQQASAELMRQMKEFAAATPLQLGDLAKGAQTMLGFNVDAEEIMPMLKAIGDISMGDAQKFQSLTLAFAQMQSVGKLMGQDLLQMINAGFSPLAVMADKTGKSIGELKEEMSAGAISADMVKQAFIDATSEGGQFFGMLSGQGDTVKGALAQLSGAFTDMFNGIGEQSEGIIKGSVKSLQWLVENYETLGKVIAGLVVTYGVHRASLMAEIAVTRIAALQTKGFATAQILLHDATKRLTMAQKALSKTMLGNPYALVAMAVIGLSYGVYKLATAETEAEKAQKRHNDQLERGKKMLEDYSQAVDDYIAKIKDANATDLQRTKAYEELLKLMPQLRGKSMDEIATMAGDDLDKLKKQNEDIIHYQQLKKEAEQARKAVEEAQRGVELAKQSTGQGAAVELSYAEDKLTARQNDLRLAEEALRIEEETQRRAEWEAKTQEEKLAYLNDQLATLERQQSVYTDMLPPQARQLALQGNIKGAIEACRDVTGVFGSKIEDAVYQTARLAGQIGNVQGQLKKVQAVPTGENYQQAYAQADREWKEADKRLKELRQSAKSTVAEVRKAEQEAEDAKKAYEALGGNTSPRTSTAPKRDRKADEAEERRRLQQLADLKADFAKRELRQAIDNEFALKQARISAQEDTIQKELELARLHTAQLKEENKRREEDWVEALQRKREEEWKLQNPAKAKEGYSYTGVTTRDDLSKQQLKQLAEYDRIATEQGVKAETDALAKRLQQFESYAQERHRIAKEYADKERDLRKPDGSLREGVTEANLDELKRQSDEALARIDEAWAEREETYQQWMTDIASMSVAQLEEELRRVQLLLAKAQIEGRDDKSVAVIRTQLEQLRKKLREIQNDTDATGKSFADWSRATETLRNTKDELESLAESIRPLSDSLAGAIQGVAGLATPVIGIIGSIGKFAEMSSKGISASATATQKAISIAEKGTVILTIISTAIQLATKIASLFNKDKRHDKNIKELDKRIADIQWRLDHWGWDKLEESAGRPLERINEWLAEARLKALAAAAATGDYAKAWQTLNDITAGTEEAGRRLADAYMRADYMAGQLLGTDRYTEARQQLDLMGQKTANIQQKINENNAKKGDYSEENERLEREMKELTEKMAGFIDNMLSDLLGGNAIQLADKLGNALFDAFSKGEDAAKAFDKSVNDIINNMVKKLLIQQFLEKPIAEAINKLKQAATKDGVLDMDALIASIGTLFDDFQKIGADAGKLQDAYDKIMQSIGADMGDMLSGDRKGIATASQDSVDELNGRATAIQTHTAMIAQGTARLTTLAQSTFDQLVEVARMVKEGNATRQRIETSTATIATKVRDFDTYGIKVKR
ncbi:MAG: tape measure protein [Porphyromonas sp.]|uniref:tape measure protein n=1 Tax=Porphyromonas sp. TaxID=1924944 RepID=UPI002A7F85F1|nr:tape measure protein [Porphyromonas sp.]MDY4245351.1 tape measure protein [Porphyromonas sp.]